jgi:hypothetical protein
MTDRNKRTIRTVVQVFIGALSAAPDIASHLPADVTIAQVVAVSAAVCHYFHLLESVPGFPSWLKLDVPSE